MPPSQDPTPPTAVSTHRLGWGNMYPRPLAWFCKIIVILFVVGFIISSLSPSSSVWFTGGFFLTLLAPSALFAIVGVLLAIGHPWGAFSHLMVGRRFAHPRIVGLALVWGAVALIGMVGTTVFVAASHVLIEADSSKRMFAWYSALVAVGVIAVAPLLSLLLFDRRR